MSFKQQIQPQIKVLKSFDEMTDEQVEAAIEKSNSFSQTWKKTSYDDRAKVLQVAELMRQRKDEFAELITRNGKRSGMGSQSSADILDTPIMRSISADKNLNPESGEAGNEEMEYYLVLCELSFYQMYGLLHQYNGSETPYY
jgi:PAB1-binding protein PBP1